MVDTNGNGNSNGKKQDFSNLSLEERQHLKRAGVCVVIPIEELIQDNKTDEEKKETKVEPNKSSSKTSKSYAEEKIYHSRRLGRVKTVYTNPLLRWYLKFWNWTGISDKKGWDILQLLIVPLFLGGATYGFNLLAKEREMVQAYRKERQDALTNFIDKVPEKIYGAEPNYSLLQAKTRTTLQLLEGDLRRREALITFLKEFSLLNKLDTAPDKLKSSELYGTLFQSINLRGTDLSEADLRDVNLKNAILERANLRAAKFNSADLSGAVLSGADLRSKDIDWLNRLDQYWKNKLLGNKIVTKYRNFNLVTTLNKANLTRASLNEAKLDGATLQFANLRGAIFGQDVELSGTDLSGANLIGAKLGDVKLAELQKVNLENAIYCKDCKERTEFPQGFDPNRAKMIVIDTGMNFLSSLENNGKIEKDSLLLEILSHTDLSNMVLTDSDFKNVNLKATNFTGSNFTNVSFNNAELEGTIFTDVDLSNTQGLTKPQLSQAKLCGTKIPADLQGLDGNKDCAGANLTGVDFTNTIFAQTKFDGAILKDAILTQVDLSNAKGLTKPQLSQAKLCRTKIPTDIQGLDGNRDCPN